MKSQSIRYEDVLETQVYENELFEDPELFSLLEQVLTEVFQVEDDVESFNYLDDQSIYFLGGEKEIAQIEKAERLKLNEGSSELENLDGLLIEAESYFSNSSYRNNDLEDNEESTIDYLTGFIQIYSGVSFNSIGEMSPRWKSIDLKIVINFQDLFRPEILIKEIESRGIKWSELIRVMIYGPGLENVIGTKIYGEDEVRELVPLSENYPNIVLAIPRFDSVSPYDASNFEFIESEINEGIMYGIIPDIGRIAFGHWEWTHVRLLEIEEEEMENRVLDKISRDERFKVSEMNDFINKYKDAKQFINGLNSKVIDPIEIYSLSQVMLENILFVCEKLNHRLQDSTSYYQIKALYSKNKVVSISTHATQALLLIDKINKGEHVDLHLISLSTMEDIFAILWSGIGIKIHSSKKDFYFKLKDSLLRMRASDARKFQK